MTTSARELTRQQKIEHVRDLDLNSSEMRDLYPTLLRYSKRVKKMERPLVGRKKEIDTILAGMLRPELCNIILVGAAGSGKTSIVQGTMLLDAERLYLEVDLSAMIAGIKSPDEMAAIIKRLFDEAELFSRTEGVELVVFMDEFHQLIMLSEAAVEGVKPVLAASGMRGLRIIAATTFEEYHKHIAENLPLVERLQRVNLSPPDRDTTVRIMRGMAKRYEVEDQFPDDVLFEMIFDYTNSYMPSSVQPRKSLTLLDAMIGYHRFSGKMIDRDLLARTLQTTLNVDVTFSMDIVKLKENLDKAVYSQKFATSVIQRRMQIVGARLNNPDRPLSSFLFAGSTGVGKALADDTLVPVLSEDGSVAWKRHGDLQVGDWVFNRVGKPVQVIGVFRQEKQEMYRVTTGDGRVVDAHGPHLWGVYDMRLHADDRDALVMTTLELIEQGPVNFSIPMNGPVQWPERQFEISPRDMGARMASRGGVGRIPQAYMTASASQRHAFVQGIIDVDIKSSVDSDFDIAYVTDSEEFAQDLRSLLFSVGVSNDLQAVEHFDNGRDRVEYAVKWWSHGYSDPVTVGIRSIEQLPEQQGASCIYVDDEEHLYQAGEFVVTHNTELTKALAKEVFGDDTGHFVRFDMSEFAEDSSLDLFRDLLTQRVWDMGHAVILLDEIEKAAKMVTRLLLQVLDDGRLNDRFGREVSFRNTYIILTTNAGSEIFRTISQYAVDDEGSGAEMQLRMREIERSLAETTASFPRELLGRVSAIVPFQPLSKTTQEKIILRKMVQLAEQISKLHGVRLHIDGKVLTYLIEDKGNTDSDSGGARAAVRTFEDEVVAEVAAFVNLYPHVREADIYIEGTMRAEDEERLKSGASVKVAQTGMRPIQRR